MLYITNGIRAIPIPQCHWYSFFKQEEPILKELGVNVTEINWEKRGISFKLKNSPDDDDPGSKAVILCNRDYKPFEVYDCREYNPGFYRCETISKKT
jgi:hypothetical protein